MAVIVDNFGSDSEWVELAAGTIGAAGTGDYTLVVMYQPLSANGAVAGLFTAGTAGRAITHNSSIWFGEFDFSGGFGAATTDDWMIVGQSKPAGSHNYRFHQYDFTTDDTPTHGEETSPGAHGDGSAIDAIRILAADGPHSWGSVAWIAVWNSVLSDADFESLCSASLQDVMALSPDMLVPCNVAALTDLVDVTGNGADYVSSTGDNITVGDDPPDYDFTLAAPSHAITLGLPEETDTAQPFFLSSDTLLQLNRPIETDSALALTFTKTMASFSKRGVEVASGVTPTITLTTVTEAVAGDLVVVMHANDAFTLDTMQTPIATGSPTMHAIPDATVDGGSGHVHIKAYWYVANTPGAQTISVTETGQADEEKALSAVILTGADTSVAIDAAASTLGSSSTQTAPQVTTDAAAFIITVIASDVFANQAAYGTPPELFEDTEWHFGLNSGVIATTLQDAAGDAGPYDFAVANSKAYGAATIAVLQGAGTPLGFPVETDSAFSVTPSIVAATLGLPLEADEAFALGGTVLGLATETDSVFASIYRKTFILGGGAVITLGIPVEEDSALSVDAHEVTHTITLGIPAEVDTALLLNVGAIVLLFSPPTVRLTNMMGYALRTTFTRSMTVWKDEGGVWRAQSVPAYEQLKAAQRLLSVGGRPEVVDSATAAELIMAGIGTVEAIPRKDAP